ncbi:TonB-dependent receptor plug domain-containing protein [Neolewinella agarilytica]|uniref:Vitamin B12 transporter n=1 Tax=Neolewinella agarilytica TaxID=478744 RepID=A0A1H8Z3N3_9BACT|nr:TonB-dependent receptor [Neolewinella agarilytica]SEP58941.1 vitamin B12 transporter [Neolewinella agarilytica]
MQPFSLSLLFVLFLSFGVFAQAPSMTTTADEVVVTGSRFSRSLTNSPQRVTVIDSVEIAQSADLAQLLSEQAGIVINGAYSNPGKDKSLFLRNGANQFTLILIDGQPLLDPSSLGGAVDLRLLSLAGIERIEILRGARSLLYGSDAVAGVINLITKKNTAPDTFTLHLRAAAQTLNTYEGSAALSGSTEKLDYQLGYEHYQTDGLSEALEPEVSPIAFGKDGAQRQTLTAGLTYRPNEYLSLRPTLRLASFDGDYDGGNFQDADNTYTNELLASGLSADYSRGDNSLGARFNYAHTDRKFNSTFGTFSGLGRAAQAEIFGVHRFTERATLTAGVQLRDEALGREDEQPDTTSATTISPYLLLNLTVAEDLLVEAGYRYNNHSGFGGQSNFSLALGVNSTDHWSSRLNLASAFQSPTLDQLAGPFGANPNLAPQVANSIEISTQLADPKGSYRINLAIFQREIKDVITFDFAAGYQNQDELLDRGVELEGFYQFSQRFTVNSSLSLVKGQLTSPDGSGGTTETEDFPRRPQTSGHQGLTYRAKAPFTARLSAHYTGQRPDVFFDENFSRIDTELDPYWLINFYAEYQLLKDRQLTLFADVRNLTNTEFTEVTGFSTLGRMIRGGFRLTL